jgi:hypothetical protein
MGKYFLHRIQKDGGAFTKGIEVHDNLDDAIRSFWGRMKSAYNNPQNPGMTFVSCKITDETGAVLPKYNDTWLKEEEPNTFFLHSIRVDGETTKAIDTYDTQDAAMIAFATAMEYGYNNPRFPNVSLVSCEITDMLSGGMTLESETWVRPGLEPAAEE